MIEEIAMDKCKVLDDEDEKELTPETKAASSANAMTEK